MFISWGGGGGFGLAVVVCGPVPSPCLRFRFVSGLGGLWGSAGLPIASRSCAGSRGREGGLSSLCYRVKAQAGS